MYVFLFYCIRIGSNFFIDIASLYKMVDDFFTMVQQNALPSTLHGQFIVHALLCIGYFR